MNCRYCKNFLKHVFTDLGETPLANSYLTKDMMNEPEKKFPLKKTTPNKRKKKTKPNKRKNKTTAN